MDGTSFDRLARHLETARTRRGVVSWLAILPFVGGVTASHGEEVAAADGRRKRRRRRHKHGQGRGRHNRHCRSMSRAKTCSGTCGVTRDNCGKKVDCGPCRCTAASCGPCMTCQANGTCAPVANGSCCPSGVCVNGACTAEASLELCEGRCSTDSIPATYQCGSGAAPVPCPACDTGCVTYGCADGGTRLFTPEGESFYCVASVAPVGMCKACPADVPNPIFCPSGCMTPGSLCTACPTGQGCLLSACVEICTGA